MNKYLAIGLYALSSTFVAHQALGGPLEDRVLAALISPKDLVGAASALELDAATTTAIQREAQNTEALVQALQQKGLVLVAELGDALDAEPIKQAQAKAKLEALLATESEIKRLRFTSWLHANALLTPAQRERALKLRKSLGK